MPADAQEELNNKSFSKCYLLRVKLHQNLEKPTASYDTIIFSYYGKNYSRAGVYLNVDEVVTPGFQFFQVPMGVIPAFLFLHKTLKRNNRESLRIVVISQSHLIVVLLRLITRKYITLDAGWSLMEAEVARWEGSKSIPKIIKLSMIDIIAFNLANRIIVESANQVEYIRQKFLIAGRKITPLFSGFNENDFCEPNEKPFELKDSTRTASFPTVLFRGSYTSEAGLEILSEVSKKLEKVEIQFIVSSNRIPKELVFGKNTILISRRISNREMKYLYEIATVCIGQITNRPRLKNTIPHKAFEAAFFGKPYLSSDTLGIREFLPDNNQCYYLEDVSVACLEEAILNITSNDELQSDLSLNIAKRYSEAASQDTLSRKFFEIISS